MKIRRLLLFLWSIFFSYTIEANGKVEALLDVLDYHVQITLKLASQQIEGKVTITFHAPPQSREVAFDSGDLTVTQWEGDYIQAVKQQDGKTLVYLEEVNDVPYRLTLSYQGKPKRGLLFLEEALYTVYFTHHWMICHFDPADHASMRMDITLPKELICVANGEHLQSITKDTTTTHSWRLDQASPAYTYGFTAGAFTQVSDSQGGKNIQYFSADYDASQLRQIFQYTPDMIAFFEEKTGIPYSQHTYSQVLVGNHYQEMAGFALLKRSYGRLVLRDSTETNLISHELAHQWWGNRISCRSWKHFWLNEGFATYMSAAYNEHRFGKEKYLKDIDSYFQVYQKIKTKGNDKSLVFPNWLNPSVDDRNLVYFKGAYVLHCLREELGDEDFWKGIKHYSSAFYGKSVTTKDFQSAMEEATEKSLGHFFDEWVY
ncbi:MAG: M1 family aminopeptidase [Bacteroidota bacterium]